MKINCIIVDDEPLSQEIMQDYVASCPELNLVGIFPNAMEARDAISRGQIDLILLDINMPRLSGINLMKSLPSPPLVVFVTAYPEFAVEGFDLEAVDYLLKPVSYERFLKAISKVTDKLQNVSIIETGLDHIMVKSDKKMYRVELDDIFYVEAQGDYIKIHLENRTMMVYGSLSSFDEKLPSDRFLRVHKSYVVGLSKIEYIEGNQIRLNGVLLPFSLKCKDELMARLNG